MRITFNDKQLEKLSELFMEFGKGFFLASFAIPIITGFDFFNLSRLLVGSIIAVYISLLLLEKRRQ